MNFLLDAASKVADKTSSGAGSAGGSIWETLGLFLPMILMFVILYFFMIRPQKKKQKEEQKMRESLQVGDEIVTIGGINGRIVSIKEDTLIIESPDHSKMQICNWAVQSNKTIHD